ncbi:hypothetical protein MJO29_011386 [Puccinia striiformis f. sp. tritici]|uniref:hypothetical protein n=1 Tax=Puccinia striiformis f. sp. tritici TaxID=168172 RepID=UPI002007A4EA|nr:hypothetical protein Pst134EA_021214 [Puccinia striiformis f. sp. tritici]KAH9457331.1 hypothetical protein Pst134EA_021214 [Puccinia striiformis f. sp. tritici]KAI7946859.1 hypothetical protein MJO29_011386 [Puccinia striiformis f. sp. tritici]KAI9624488.1 hypothetical protein KEM48_008813 [Puccinia striiformis f. sp. tritici PST-130]
MSRRHLPSDTHQSRYSTTTQPSQYRKRQLEPTSPNQFHRAQRDPVQLPRASTSTRSIIGGNSSLRPFDSAADHHSRQSLKPSKRTITVTSPGWDPIGDDDALYIQSDDTHLRDLAAGSQKSTSNTRLSRLDQTVLQARKRKRTASQQSSFDQNQPTSRPSSTSQTSRPPLKHDAEGCSNCRTKRSTCWYKKNKAILLSDGTEAWGEEKLCNPCSIHWNKNGYHRNVRPKPPKQIAKPRQAIPPPRSPSPRPRRSCPSDFPAGLSSPTASIRKANSSLARHTRRSRSPSQLTLAAEREARIVKRSVAKAHAKSNALRQRKETTSKFGYISEEEDELYDNPPVSPPLPPPRPSKHTSRRVSRTITQQIDSTTISAETLFARGTLPGPSNAFSSYHPSQQTNHTETVYQEKQTSGSFSNQYPSSDPFSYFEPPHQNICISPPRTPPPNSHISTSKNVTQTQNSPGQLFDFGNILSPSFLNGSPNSLLRRLNSQKHLNDSSTDQSNLSASYLGVSDKVFSPSRFLASPSKSNPLPPVAEPSKKAAEISPPNTHLIGSAGLLDAHLNSGSSGHSQKNFIFSPSRSGPKSKENEPQTTGITGPKSQKGKFSTAASGSIIPDQTIGPCKVRRHKRISAEGSYRDPIPPFPTSRSMSDIHIEVPYALSRTASGSSSKKTQPPPSSGGHPIKPLNQTMARTIWCRRLETAGASSEDSQLEELFGKKLRGQPPLESRYSEDGQGHSKSTPMERGMVDETGLSSAVFRGLNPSFSASERARSARLGSGLGYSDGQMMLSASSPPVLPPPSDCSEGITPHSGEAPSDEPDKEPDEKDGRLSRTTSGDPCLMSRRNTGEGAGGYPDYGFPINSLDQSGPLADITSSLNRHLRPPQQPSTSSTQGRLPRPNHPSDQLDALSPEILAALSEAMKAGLSPNELADALRALDGPPPMPSVVAPVAPAIPFLSEPRPIPQNRQEVILDPALERDFPTTSTFSFNTNDFIHSHHQQHNFNNNQQLRLDDQIIDNPFSLDNLNFIFNNNDTIDHLNQQTNEVDYLLPFQDIDGFLNLTTTTSNN